MSNVNDNKELEDLFDQVSSQVKNSKIENKEEDLEALFDKISKETATQSEETNVDNLTEEQKRERIFNRIGGMVRNLHNTLGEIRGSNDYHGKIIEKAINGAIPDTKDRLNYVANLTENAANRVLNATDIINPLVEQLGNRSRDLSVKWDMLFSNQLNIEEFKLLAIETRDFLKSDMNNKLGSTHNQMTEIMMAQDFQDLTGQVIKKIITLTQDLESGLMAVLVDMVPEDKRNQQVKQVEDMISGPVVNPEGRSDVVVNQKQVDDLLDSLGF